MKRAKFLIGVFLVSLLAVPSAHADPARLQHLYSLFIKNEGSMAYLKHCADMNLYLVENPNFTSNAEATMVALAKEAMKEKPGMTLAEATEMVTQKQEALSADYHAIYKRKRCSSAEARAGKAHFDFLKSVPPRTVDALFAPPPAGEVTP